MTKSAMCFLLCGTWLNGIIGSGTTCRTGCGSGKVVFLSKIYANASIWNSVRFSKIVGIDLYLTYIYSIFWLSYKLEAGHKYWGVASTYSCAHLVF